jgi:phosphatidylinositol alpha-mannosyltransferase
MGHARRKVLPRPPQPFAPLAPAPPAPGAPAPRRRGPREPCRLRIWVVSQSFLPYYGGITEHVWHLTAELARRGHDVRLITGGGAGAPPGGEEPAPPGVTLTRVGRTLRVPSHGARACVTVGRFHALHAAAESAPEILHLQSPLEPCLPLWALHHLPGLKIGTFHTGGRRPHWAYRCFSPWLARPAARLAVRLAVSREAARFVARHLPSDYRVVPNGVDLARFAATAAARAAHRPAPGRRARLLFVGRLDPRKGLATLLQALQGLREAGCADGGREVEMQIVGDGPLRASVRRTIAAHRLPVTLLGALPRRALAECYRAADILVAPATDGESCGVTLLEALAAGVPIVASDLPGYRETLGRDPGALFFRPGSAGELCAALRTLLADPARCRALAAAGRRRAERFCWRRIAAEIEGLYFEALAAARALRLASPGVEADASQALSRAMRSSPRRVSASSTS